MSTLASTRQLSALILRCALVLVFTALAHGAHAEQKRVEVLVRFETGAITEDPALTNGVFAVKSATKTAALSSLATALTCTHVIENRLSPRFKIEGPWLISLFSDMDPQMLLAQIRAEEGVLSADLNQQSRAIASEVVPAIFPDSSRDLFCPTQPQLHRRISGEAALDGSNCSQVDSGTDHDMDLPQAWSICEGDSDVVVAVIDVGFDLVHPGLGGPGPAFSVDDSLLAYNDGVWFRNWKEFPGEADAATDMLHRPGAPGVDDDNDGYVDEDPWGFLPAHGPESDVVHGEFDSISATTITDSSATWAVDELRGRLLCLTLPPLHESTFSVMIEHNTPTTITTQDWFLGIPIVGPEGWRTIAALSGATHYKVGNGVDNDGDQRIDDLGYVGCPEDDDESGKVDDYRGWDFVDFSSWDRNKPDLCPNEDYFDQDNNPTGLHDHGTSVVSQIASARSSGRMMGVAPGVKILPLRIGASVACGEMNDAGEPDDAALVRALEYAIEMDVDVISLSLAPVGGAVTPELLEAAVNKGIIVVWAAGNTFLDHGLMNSAPDEVVFVGGLGPNDARWLGGDWGESNYGRWVDVSARAHLLTVAVWGVDRREVAGHPELPWVSWMPANEWHGYAYAPLDGTHAGGGQSGTSLATPIVAGIMGLVKSAYPHWTAQQVIDKVLGSTDNIYGPGMVDSTATWLGSGRVNAYKALTFYGNVAANGNATWDHELWVGGDVLVPEGRTLTVAPGTTVNVAVDDLTSGGADGTKIEFVINGTMVIQGDPSAPVKFKVFQAGGDSTEYVFMTVVNGTTFTIDDMPAQVSKFLDVSSTSGLNYAGTPYAAAALDFNGDHLGDLLVTLDGYGPRLYAGDVPGEDPDAPRFAAVSLPGTPPQDCRGVAVADFDNDGDEDIFLTHASTPKLYRNDGPLVGFTDATDDLMLASLADKSTAACWTDIDRDGWLDLYVVRSEAVGVPACSNVTGLQHRLFHNAMAQGDGLVDATSTAGLTGVANLAALSVCASDIDGDHDIDLFVPMASMWPGGSSPHSLLLVNDGTGHFSNASATKLDAVVASCPAAEFADMDNDSDADLVVANDTGSPRVFLNDGSGSYLSGAKVIDAPEGHSGLKVLDQDLDGRLDVLLLPRDANHACRLFSGYGDISFVETTASAGLQTQGPVGAVAAADFNSDGDADLFLGLPVTPTNQFLFRSAGSGGSANLARKYVKIRLDSEIGANNRDGIGARVKVTAGSLVQTLTPDGGGGCGGQGDRTLVFGLKDYDGPVSATVYWPGGWVTTVPSLQVSDGADGNCVDCVNVIADDTKPTVSNLLVTILVQPTTGEVTWGFQWDTDVSSDPKLDTVELDQPGPETPCLPGLTEINDESGLAHLYAAKAGGGYRHKYLGLTEVCYSDCKVKVRAASMAGTLGSTTPWQIKKVLTCPSQY
jgi:enediyne biosynthesis protein E4